MPVRILRDTGASQSYILQDTLPFSQESSTGKFVLSKGFMAGPSCFPLHKIFLKSNLVSGPVVVGLTPEIPVKGIVLLLGNDLAGGKVFSPTLVAEPLDENCSDEKIPDDVVYPACVVTRAMSKHNKDRVMSEQDDIDISQTFMCNLEDEHRAIKDGQSHSQSPGDDKCVDSIPDFSFSRDQLRLEQERDPEIVLLKEKALPMDEIKKVPIGYFVENEILMRKWRPSDGPADGEWNVVNQVVVPKVYRPEILKLAHDIPLGGHLGVHKTKDKIMRNFFWPGIRKEVAEFCKTCHTCQMIGKSNSLIPVAPIHMAQNFAFFQDESFVKESRDCENILDTISCENKTFPWNEAFKEPEIVPEVILLEGQIRSSDKFSKVPLDDVIPERIIHEDTTFSNYEIVQVPLDYVAEDEREMGEKSTNSQFSVCKVSKSNMLKVTSTRCLSVTELTETLPPNRENKSRKEYYSNVKCAVNYFYEIIAWKDVIIYMITRDMVCYFTKFQLPSDGKSHRFQQIVYDKGKRKLWNNVGSDI